MPDKYLHIISFDVPLPANYGGAIDVIFKIKSLYEAGCKIFLHCFDYGRGHQIELQQYCEKVFYYKRATGITGFSFQLPYIVSSRKSDELLKNLLNYPAPIFFEGVHTTKLLHHPSLYEYKKFVRLHNLEFDYYRQLVSREHKWFSKLYFYFESILLERYEAKKMKCTGFFPVSDDDRMFFLKHYPTVTNITVPPFHPNKEILSLTGYGSYILYHGNLAHPENIEAAAFILDYVCDRIDFPFIFAGRNPDDRIVEKCKQHKNVTLVANPDTSVMKKLVIEAHIHLIPTFQGSGVKLKLMESLFTGRHVIATPSMLVGTGVDESICHIASTADDMVNKCKTLIVKEFNEKLLEIRRVKLARFDNKVKAAQIIKAIFG